MMLACDNGISMTAIKELQARGHEVVYWADDEHDEWWFRAALDAGAEVFISHDWDIVLMADARYKPRIHMKQGIGGARQAAFILRKLEAL